MLALIFQTVKKSRWAIIGYTAASALLTWMLVAIYPTFATEEMSELFQFYPEDILKALGVADIGSIFASLEGFIAVEMYSFMWPIILIILVIAFGAGALAGEIEQGTIGILLSQPISRAKLFLGKYIAGAAITLIFVFASTFATVLFALLHGVDFELPNYLTLAALSSAFALAIFSVTMMLSSFFSERGKVTLLAAAMLMGMYFITIISSLKDSLENLKYISFFHYFDYSNALAKNELSTTSLAIFLGVILVSGLIGLLWFRHRDIAAS